MEEKRGDNQVSLFNRKKLEVLGVINVDSYDEEEILLETNLGNMVIKGQGLHITSLNLNEGKLTVDGLFSKIEYVEDKGANLRNKGKGIISKLLR